MKTSRSKIFCRDCNRPKLLFKEEKNALNFIKFNAGKYSEKTPVRAYFCNVCMGWHLTSKKGESYMNPAVEKVIQQYHNGYKGQMGKYGDETISMSNIVLSQCSALKRDMKISQKNIWKKTRLLNKYRSILSTRLNPHDFALIERSINEIFAIIERRYNSAEFSYDSASTSYEN